MLWNKTRQTERLLRMHKIVQHILCLLVPPSSTWLCCLCVGAAVWNNISFPMIRAEKNNDGNLSEGFAVKHGRQTDTEVHLEKALTFPAWLESTEQQRDELLTLTHTPLRRFSERLSRHTHRHTQLFYLVYLVQCDASHQFISDP